MQKKSSNKNLHKASQAKKDEFYTQLVDIEKELKHYKDQFKGKVVYCNCDDPFESNFFKYFASKFNELKLKKLITTSYSGSPIVGQQLLPLEMEGLKPKAKEPYVVEITKVTDINNDGAIGLEDIEVLLKRNKKSSRKLNGNGDFRSPECIELLKEADIVVTNPPFSLFREYVAQLVEYNKKFLILGNQNAITYKEVFKLIQDNKMWLGYDNGGTKWFQVPKNYEIETESRIKVENGVKYFSMGSIVWFTNLDTTRRHEKLILYKQYVPEEYPKYDFQDIIEVSRVAEIPLDYDKTMAVPKTFIDKYNPEQFELLGFLNGGGKDETVQGKHPFARILIKNKEVKK